MYFWNLPRTAPVLLGYYRLIENVPYTFDFMIFEIIMCSVLYLMARGILLMKIMKLERANEEANSFFTHLSQEPNSFEQNKYLLRCLNMSDVALHEYDSLLMFFSNLQHRPTRRVCVQRWPANLDLMRKISAEESFQCLKSTISASKLDAALNQRRALEN